MPTALPIPMARAINVELSDSSRESESRGVVWELLSIIGSKQKYIVAVKNLQEGGPRADG